ncbi:hypothetical protein [uncultured Methanobrevibacter sp.]|uniref:hypothetical protein n=1 Tax=uncultured Methanobrevibacter sp. TaxID=253161 RepID=UPI0026003DB5|nr:hypothetical protein [uncultured Methanobrevibacter sp.]
MKKLVEITDDQLTTLNDVVFVLEQHIEDYVDVMEASDRAKLEADIVNLKKIIDADTIKPKVKHVTDKNAVQMAYREGRESVCPNYSLCVFSTFCKDTLYLTDDYEKAMQKAKSQSLIHNCVFTVYDIKKAKDNSYRVFENISYDNGNVFEFGSKVSFHFDFISQVANNIVKI